MTMTTQTLRTPKQLMAYLLSVSTLCSAALATVVLLTAPIALASDAYETGPMLRIVGTFIAASWNMSALVMFLVMRGVAPLYQIVSSDGQTFSPESVLRAYQAPGRVMLGYILGGVVVLALDYFSRGWVSGLDGSLFWTSGLFLLGWVPLALLPMLTLWRRGFSEWLKAVPPSEFNLAAERSLARRAISRVVIPLLAICSGLAAVFLSYSARPGGDLGGWERATLIGLVIVGIPSLGGWGAWLVGRRAAVDLRELKAWMGSLISERGDERTERVSRPAYATGIGEELMTAIEALKGRHVRLTNQEMNARKKVEAARRMKSRFLAYMSHDLRSPLNSIQGFAEILSRESDGPLNSAQRESVEMIRESGKELLLLVSNILDTAKIEAGKMRLLRGWVPPVETITQAVGESRALAEEKGVRLETEMAAGMPPLYIDGARVLQAVSAVLRRAVRVTRGTEIRVVAKLLHQGAEGQRWVEFSVVDSVGGIRAEDCERIQEVMREVDQPTGKRFGGSDLGLSLALALLREHEGELTFEHIPGAQARFDARLPVSSGDEERRRR